MIFPLLTLHFKQEFPFRLFAIIIPDYILAQRVKIGSNKKIIPQIRGKQSFIFCRICLKDIIFDII